MSMTSGPVNIGFKIPYAVFDKYPVRMETDRAGNNAQIDIILYRARLFKDREALEEAAALIEETGYGRRKEELADAREAAKQWPASGPPA